MTISDLKLQKNVSSIYIHFPFCEAKCHYCDFFSFAEKQFSTDAKENIYHAIESEVKLFKHLTESRPSTIFLGGGTPSLVPTDHLAQILQHWDTANTEVTLEANPASLKSAQVKEWTQLGINRISMGTQSLHADRLKWLGRVHSLEDIHISLNRIFDAGISNVSVDYILGVPTLTTKQIESELTSLLTQYKGITHISCYLLTLHNSSIYFKELPNEKIQIEQLLFTVELLRAFGFEQYEISNFSKSNYHSRHNSNYWSGESYLGLGPSAHGYFQELKLRTQNWPNLKKYQKSIEQKNHAWFSQETLTQTQLCTETLMLRLRTKLGLDLHWYYEKFGIDLIQQKHAVIDQLIRDSLAKVTNNHIQLTPQGLFLSDQIIANLMCNPSSTGHRPR